MPDWKRCEGQLLAGKYPLERCIGSDAASALFVIGIPAAAAKIRLADAVQAAVFVERWNRVRLLRHPNLMEIDAAGASVIAGEPVAYLVMEHADENLADILDERPLTVSETREMLLQVASALEHLHGHGMVHGDLKASNVLAIEDRVKLSSESIDSGDAATDIRSLGSILIHALTQRPWPISPGHFEPVPDLPAPFDAVAKGCLEPDRKHSWSASEILARIRSDEHAASSPAPQPTVGNGLAKRPKLRQIVGWASLAAAGVAVVAGLAIRRTDPPSPAVPDRRLPAEAAVTPAPATPVPATAPDRKQPTQSNKDAASTRDRLVIEEGIARRVTPTIPEKARSTIQGRPVVVVRVTVDSAGDVTEAVVERSFSPYFGNFALKAARQWKFEPNERANSRSWILRFQFTPAKTQVFAQRTARE